MVNKLTREYKARDGRMAKYLEKVNELMKSSKAMKIEQMGCQKNKHADSLACLDLALESKDMRNVWVEHVNTPSIEES